MTTSEKQKWPDRVSLYADHIDDGFGEILHNDEPTPKLDSIPYLSLTEHNHIVQSLEQKLKVAVGALEKITRHGGVLHKKEGLGFDSFVDYFEHVAREALAAIREQK